MILELFVTEEVGKASYMKNGESKTRSYQVCDLYMPGSRHPVDYEHSFFRDEQMLMPGRYFLGGESFNFDMQWKKIDLHRYDLQWIPEDVFFRWATAEMRKRGVKALEQAA